MLRQPEIFADRHLVVMAIARERLPLGARPVFLLPPGRVCQRWKDPVPFALFRALLADQKYNRAARSGVRPIFDRYPKKRNQDGLADCGNKCSRWQHKSAGHAQPFPIVALDRYRCLLRPSVDLRRRFGGSGSQLSRSTRTRTFQKLQGKAGRVLSQLHLRSFGFHRIQKCRHSRSAAEAEQHQAKMKCENEMGSGQQKRGNSATAQVGQRATHTLDKRH